MFKKIINNLIYKKRFKNVKFKDIKLHYNLLIASSVTMSLLSVLLTGIITFIFKEFSHVFFLDFILILVLLFSALISSIFMGISGMFIFERLFKIKKIKRIIDNKDFSINFIEKENGENYYELSGADFISKDNDVLKENLTNEDIQNLTFEFISEGIKEEDVKKLLKLRLEEKENLNITLQDFCFIAEDLTKIKEKQNELEKKQKISEIVDKILIKEKEKDYA